MSLEDHVNKLWPHPDGSWWRLVKAAAPTPEEQGAIRAKQAACSHDSTIAR